MAERLADLLDAGAVDHFVPATIVVPNRCVRKWLRLHLARRLGVAINLQFRELDDALWQLLPATTPVPTPIDQNAYRLMVLSVLLDENDAALAPWRGYLQLQERSLSRLSCRRAWFLADRLAKLLCDYEYDRHGSLITRWQSGRAGGIDAKGFAETMERAQRALFKHLIHEPDGRRALLIRAGEGACKTLPQYAVECMEREATACSPQTVHFFGFTHLSDMHIRIIGWLGKIHDVRLHVPILTDTSVAQTFLSVQQQWGRAGAESWTLLSRLADCGFAVERISTPEQTQRTTVLARLQSSLLGRPTGDARIEQDASLQIIGCAGPLREVETVHDSILANLHADHDLRQTDIGVLVGDMTKYRAAVQAVFERQPRALAYNLLDYSAAATSTFGQAVLDMLDLALDSFARSRVFQVLLNPCFLARLGIARADAMTWLEWAQRLGIHQGWDAEEKHAQGYPRSPFYAWKLGLERLRLGRYMGATDDAGGLPPRFGHVIPFADLESSDRERLDAFCLCVETLLPALAKLRGPGMTGERWANALWRLMTDFLDVPENRPEEEQVRDALLASIEALASWDALSSDRLVPLALVREFVQTQLDELPGRHGDYLTGGVTIAELQPMRPTPFSIIYILGLGDDVFPGSNALSSFDMRGAAREPGDIRPAEQRLYDFLSAIVSARKKLYLLYSNHDLQRDQPLLPAVPLEQLRSFLNERVVTGKFAMTQMPTEPSDERWIDPSKQPGRQDVLVQHREAERIESLAAAIAGNRLELTDSQGGEWQKRVAVLRPDFKLPVEGASAATGPVTVRLSELRRFLLLPADAALRRHLRVEDEDVPILADDEPLVTPGQAANAFIAQSIVKLVQASMAGEASAALTSWPERAAQTYADARLRSLAPEEAFGEIDRATLLRDLRERIDGAGRIAPFLTQHAPASFCGPLLLGESTMPLGARLRFPALRLRPGHELPAGAREIRLVGWSRFAWHAERRVELLAVTNFDRLDARKVSPALIEPMVFLLAMHANAESNAEGVSPQAWLAGRDWLIHVAFNRGIQTWTIPAGTIAPAEAARYLAALAADLLDPGQFDLLPFEVIANDIELARAMDCTFAGKLVPETYREMLEERIAFLRDSAYGYRIPPLVDMAGATVPLDALDKVQRRFRLLDRGPSRIRHR